MLQDNPKDMGLKNVNEVTITQENEDEFDDYFEQNLMKEADSMGIFEQAKEAAATTDPYTQCLKKVEQNISAQENLIDTNEDKKSKDDLSQHEQDLEDYADQRMNEMFDQEKQSS